MSFNSSSSSNASLVLPLLSSSNSSLSCFVFTNRAASIIAAFTVTKILLLLPLCFLVLYLGHQQWRRERSGASMSHSDLITYHMVAIEMIGLLGGILYCFGEYTDLPEMMTAARFIFSMTNPGQMSSHILTCVERYLAVVHPITYLGLRKACGVRIRNVSIGCVWLLCFGWLGLMALVSPAPLFCLLVFSLIVTSFCSLSVLRALKCPGPGEVDRDRERVDQSKQRAFYTIMAIMGVLLLWLVGLLVTTALGK